MIRHIVCILLAVLLATESLAKIYEWKDEKGNVHYSDKKPAKNKVKLRKFDESSISSSSVGTNVILYSTSWCGYCKKARRYFKRKGISFTEYDIEKDSRAKRRYDQFGGKGVPVIFVGKKRMNGFNESSFERLYKS